MTLLITGSRGILGEELKNQFPEAICPTHSQLDITNNIEVNDFFISNKIDEVIHAGALTSIRNCEANKQLAWDTNVQGTRNIVTSLKNHNEHGFFIYISTACVFRGDEKMYDEESIPNPANFYAITKLIGESIVQTLPNHLIIRTNFVGKTQWPYKKAFTDRFGTYLFANDVAKGIRELYEVKQKGIIHITGDKTFSMFDLAKMTTNDIEPMTINDYSGPHLTMNMTLDTKKWKKYKISDV